MSEKKSAFAFQVENMKSLMNVWRQDSKIKETSLEKLLETFEKFSEEYLTFIESIQAYTNAPKFVQNDAVLRQLQEEWVTFSQVCQQWQSTEFEDALEKASIQAKKYYERFQLATNLSPIVYFEKVYAIRRYYFTSHALISIPMRLYNSVNELQALAHELGHHIYWNSLSIERFRMTHREMFQALITKLKVPHEASPLAVLWGAWFEETFADICGTMIGGISFAQSSQRMSELSLSASYFSEKHTVSISEHPDSIVRPLIAVETLAWIIENTEGVAEKNREVLKAMTDELESRWAKVLNHPKLNLQFEDLPLASVRNSIKDAVNSILDFKWDGVMALGDLFKVNQWVDSLPVVELGISLGAVETVLDKLLGEQTKIEIEPDTIGSLFARFFNEQKSLSEANPSHDNSKQVIITKTDLDRILSMDLSEKHHLLDTECAKRTKYLKCKKVGTTWVCCC